MGENIMTDKSWEDIDRRLTAIEDKEQIRNRLYRYARGVDRAEVALTHDFYWEDGVLAFGSEPMIAHENMEAYTREHAAKVLDANPADIPFAAIYLLDDERKTARLLAGTRLPTDHAGPTHEISR